MWKVFVGLEKDDTPRAVAEIRSPRLIALEWLAGGLGVDSEVDVCPVSSTTHSQYAPTLVNVDTVFHGG